MCFSKLSWTRTHTHMVIQKLISQPNHPKARWQKAGGWTVVVVGDMRILQLITQLLTNSSWPRNPRQTCPCNLLACKHASKQAINQWSQLACNLHCCRFLKPFFFKQITTCQQVFKKFPNICIQIETHPSMLVSTIHSWCFSFVWFSPCPLLHTSIPISLSLSLAIRRRVWKVLNWSNFPQSTNLERAAALNLTDFFKVFSIYFWSTKFQRLFSFPVLLIYWKLMNLSKKLAKLVEFTLKKKFLKNPNLLFCVCVWRKRQNNFVEKRKHCTHFAFTFWLKVSEIPKSSGAMKKTQVTWIYIYIYIQPLLA